MSKKRRMQMQKRRPQIADEQAKFQAEWQEMTEALLSGKPYEAVPPMPRGNPLTGDTFRRWSEEWDAIRPLLFQHALDAYRQGDSPQAAAESAVQKYAPWSDDDRNAEWRAGYIEWLVYSLPTWDETGKLPA